METGSTLLCELYSVINAKNTSVNHVKVIKVGPSEKAAKSKRETQPFELKWGRADNIPLKSDYVNVVRSCYSLHEWENPEKVFSEVLRVLKEDGILLLKDFNRDYPRWRFGISNLKTLLFYGKKCARDHLESYETAYTFDEILVLLREAGFGQVDGERKGLGLYICAVKRNKS